MNSTQTLDDYLSNLLEEASTTPAVPAPVVNVVAAAPVIEPEPMHKPPAAIPAPIPVQENKPLERRAPEPSDPPERRRRATDRHTRWLQMRIGHQDYGVELLKVQEVVRLPALLPLRGAAPAMLGVMNLRGQIVPVLDLGMWLGNAPIACDSRSRIVVLESTGETLGLLVSAVENVVNVSDSTIETPVGAGQHGGAFRGVARLAATPIVLLDAAALMH